MGEPTAATVTGPVTGGVRGWPFGASALDVSALGYVEEEYFIEGSAERFRAAAGTELGRDGHWLAESAGTASYRTRLLVYRPVDSAQFNGTAVVTWNNVTAGHDLFWTDSLEIFEGGFALVCATTQRVGIEGLPPVNQGLVAWDPERYGSLVHPGDDYSYDIFTQAGAAVGPRRDRAGVDPMGGLDVQRVVAQGASQSAGRLATYVNAIQPLSDTFDGFILTIYFGRGTPLEVGDTVVNINDRAEGESAQSQLRGANLLRDDRGVPVFVVNSELEAIACHGVRQPDSETFRYWESAGTCHLSAQGLAARAKVLDRDGVVSRQTPATINAIPMNPLYDAAHHHMHRWLTGEGAPPIQPRIEFAGDPPEVVRDVHGIAIGGIRLPQVEVPLATNSAVPLSGTIFALLEGSSHPFDEAKVRELYGNRDEFLARFEAAAETAVAEGVLLPRDVDRLVDEARSSWPG